MSDAPDRQVFIDGSPLAESYECGYCSIPTDDEPCRGHQAERVEADDAFLDAEAMELFNARYEGDPAWMVIDPVWAEWRKVARAARRIHGAEAKPVIGASIWAGGLTGGLIATPGGILDETIGQHAKPVTTVEELDALPIGASVKDRNSDLWRKRLATQWVSGQFYSGPENLLIYGPFTLVSVPEATA